MADGGSRWHAKGSEQRWLSNSDRNSAPGERQRKRTVSGWSPIPPLNKLVVDCPQTSLLVLPCTNKALHRAEQGPSRSCYCNRSLFWLGLLFSARKTTIITSAHSPGSWTRVRGSQRQAEGGWLGGWMPCECCVVPVWHFVSGSEVSGTAFGAYSTLKCTVSLTSWQVSPLKSAV